MPIALLSSLLAAASSASPAWITVETPWPEGTQPCALAAGDGGVLWMADRGDGLGSVWKLVDADGDRRFEKATRFADGLVEPRAVLADGPASVLVLEPSSLLRLTDIDGDGQFDASRIVAKAEGATGLVRGSDGWIRLIGAGTSVDVGNRAVRSRRSWPMTGRAAERPDGSWLSADGSTVVVVAASDHAIVRNPGMPAPWGSVVAERLDGEISAIAADGDGALLIESEGPVTELRRRSLAVDGPRLSLGIPEAIATFPRDRPFAMVPLADGSFALATPSSLRIVSDGRGPTAVAGRSTVDADSFDPLRSRDPALVAAAVLAGGGQPDELALPRFENAFAAAGADKAVRDSIVAGLSGREIAFLDRLLAGFPSESPSLDAMCRSVADSVLAANDEAATRRLVELAVGLGDRPRSREAILGRVLAATEPNARLRRTLFVDLEPSGWRDLVASGSSPAAAAIDPHLRWPDRNDLPPLPDPDAGLDLVELGRRTYALCVTCHGSGGLGQPGVYPPLKGSDWVNGDPRRLVRILIHGLQGPIVVNDEPYASVMQLPRSLNDREIAAVLTYIRQSWGNDSVDVDESLVREIRSTTAGRTAAWTNAELEAVLRGTAP